MPKEKSRQEAILDIHVNAPKIRIDIWNELNIAGNHLSEALESGKDITLFEKEINRYLAILKPIEKYCAFPGYVLFKKIEQLFAYEKNYQFFTKLVSVIVYFLSSKNYNYKEVKKLLKERLLENVTKFSSELYKAAELDNRNYFEVIFLQRLTKQQKQMIKQNFNSFQTADQKFIFELVFLDSAEDAIIAMLLNYNIKGIVISEIFNLKSKVTDGLLRRILDRFHLSEYGDAENTISGALSLGNIIHNLRPELNLYFLMSSEPEKYATNLEFTYGKIFYLFENYMELHLSIVNDIATQYETPFFNALRDYALKPRSAFHALPVARGKSVFNSPWLKDMVEFYGENIFLAESSATAGGLDSLMAPIGTIKLAMERAAHYFGSKATYFVTNGTSASNKIVIQSLLKPGDIVLADHACHKSTHYGVMMVGADMVYLNGYPIPEYDTQGTVPLKDIKTKLLYLKKLGLLDRVKVIVLTNCTFDGLVYNVQQYMQEILAIKPDITFFWDEAWFAFARALPHYRSRTAMYAAKKLHKRYKSAAYREKYLQYQKEQKKSGKNAYLLPDPDKVVIRVYATQSTHKSLSCLRQGSMIHVYDEQFESIRENFTHAFMLNLTTSPNYQILATMDLARRQIELEGYELTQHAVELSMVFRQSVNNDPTIVKYFRALGPSELIPESFRKSKVKSGYKAVEDWVTVERAWKKDDAVVEPTRVLISVKYPLTNGFEMKRILMDQYGIQINKASVNTILIQFNIGTRRGSVAYFLGCLSRISSMLQDREQKYMISTSLDQTKANTKIERPPTLPYFTEFHSKFSHYKDLITGNLRDAYYLGMDHSKFVYMKPDQLLKEINKGKQFVSAGLIIPEPPGYPALTPGQIITKDILIFLLAIDPSTILGYIPEKGLKVFSATTIKSRKK